MITVGSLFSGIGGIDLGLERAGLRVIWQAETDPYASKVLAKHWPDVPNLGDVTQVEWSEVECPDVIVGGFPCQPVSLAGRGLAQLDERWLWPEFERCVRSLRPGHVFVENVPGLLVRGMGDVLGDLAALGYDAEWTGVPAAAVGAPHLRWRILIVAHARGDQHQGNCFALGGQTTEELSVADADQERRRGWSGVFGPGGRTELANGSLGDPDGQRELQPGGLAHRKPATVWPLKWVGA